ncbi:glycosyltransferase family 9 protein, partial [Candidatus Dependentiae bacterium]
MKILILRVSSIGDVIHTLPAIFFIKKQYPKAQISWLAQKKVADLLINQPFLKNVYVLSNKFLSPKNWNHTLKVIKTIKKTQWDAILDFQGILKTSIFLAFLKGKKYGFDSQNARLGLTSLFTNHNTKPIYKNIIQKNLALVSSMLLDIHKKHNLSCPTIQKIIPEFELTINSKNKTIIHQWIKKNNIEKFIIIAPNTTWPSKHWPEKHWELLFKLLLKEKKIIKNFSIILIGENFDKQAKNLALKIKSKNLNIKICPPWDLVKISYFIKKSELLIAPDTGLLHIADFLYKKTIGIFGPTNAKVHGPFFKKENINNAIQIKCPHFYQKTHNI